MAAGYFDVSGMCQECRTYIEEAKMVHELRQGYGLAIAARSEFMPLCVGDC